MGNTEIRKLNEVHDRMPNKTVAIQWRRLCLAEERYLHNFIIASAKLGEEGITMCGCFSGLGDGPFLFQQDGLPVHKSNSTETWIREFGVEELDWHAQNPDFNMTSIPLR